MGKPVRITDFGETAIFSFSERGLVYGLRAGEKLHEECTNIERFTPTIRKIKTREMGVRL